MTIPESVDGLTPETVSPTAAVVKTNLPTIGVRSAKTGHVTDLWTDKTAIAAEAVTTPHLIVTKAPAAATGKCYTIQLTLSYLNLGIETLAATLQSVTITKNITTGALVEIAAREGDAISEMTIAVVGVVATTAPSTAWHRTPTSRRKIRTLPIWTKRKMNMQMSSGMASSGSHASARRPTSTQCRST